MADDLAPWQSYITTDKGVAIANASVAVEDESDQSTPQLYDGPDSGIASPLGNPVQSDSTGFVQFYVVNGRYKISVTANGVTIAFRHVPIFHMDQGVASTDSPTFQTVTAAEAVINGQSLVDLINGLDWRASVLTQQNAPPGSPSTGDRHLVGPSPSGAWVGHANEIAEWDGSQWVYEGPQSEGWVVNVEGTNIAGRTDMVMIYTSAAGWVNFGSAVHHEALQGLQGGNATEQFHLTSAQHASVANIVTAGHAESMDQGVATTDAPTFAGATMSEAGDAAVDFTADNDSSDGGPVTARLRVIGSSANLGNVELFDVGNSRVFMRYVRGTAVVNFTNVTLREQGQRVYSPNNKPTKSDVGLGNVTNKTLEFKKDGGSVLNATWDFNTSTGELAITTS